MFTKPTRDDPTIEQEESRRKLEYQKELIKQIEEKRKEVERLREKEKLEEEMLTRYRERREPKEGRSGGHNWKF